MMFNFIKKVSVLGSTLLLAGCNSVDMEKYVDELYDRMSQEERIAQLRSGYMDELFDEDGNLDVSRCEELIPHGIGHFSQYASQKTMDPNVHWLLKHSFVLPDQHWPSVRMRMRIPSSSSKTCPI